MKSADSHLIPEASSKLSCLFRFSESRSLPDLSSHTIACATFRHSPCLLNLSGLFAAGEVAAGPHGADRLGGNMAVTCQVFGRRAGTAAAERARSLPMPDISDIDTDVQRLESKFKRHGMESESVA